MFSEKDGNVYFIDVNGVEKYFLKMNFGRQIEQKRKLVAFQESAKTIYVEANKRIIRRALKDLKAKEAYCVYEKSLFAADNIVKVFYKD